MKHLLFGLLAATLLGAAPAGAATEAMISFHGTDNESWARRAAVQDLLRDHYGFDRVKVLVDATADEVPARVRRFLEKPARPGDRRFVWVSGLKGAEGKTVCPGRNAKPVRPTAAALVLAPGCFAQVMRFPQGARHYGLSAPDPRNRAARIGRIDAADPALLALLNLPVGDVRFVAGADTLVFDAIKAGKQAGVLDPARLLTALRSGFRWNGSRYTPALDLFYRGAETDTLAPFGFLPRQPFADKLNRVRPVKRRAGVMKVHEAPTPHGAAA
ncbi:MAG: hypothetical protein OXR84_10130, partial [Magnetovibrio sp.]|nr:hypothetical protein [Magnetovibrio sp.]